MGKKVNPYLLNALHKPYKSGFAAYTLDKVKVRAALKRTANWDIYLAFGVPEKLLNQEINEKLAKLSLFALAAAILIAFISIKFSRFITSHFRKILYDKYDHPDERYQAGPVKDFNELAKLHIQIEKATLESMNEINHLRISHSSVKEALTKSQMDAITSLPTRAYFFESLTSRTVSSNEIYVYAIMLIDLDGFKAVNDSLGHEYGDITLKKTADMILESVRGDDLTCRYGGDEFLIAFDVQDETSTGFLEKIADSIISKIKNIQSGLGASIGITLWKPQNEAIEVAIKRADKAMYKVKQSGKNSYYFSHTH